MGIYDRISAVDPRSAGSCGCEVQGALGRFERESQSFERPRDTIDGAQQRERRTKIRKRTTSKSIRCCCLSTQGNRHGSSEDFSTPTRATRKLEIEEANQNQEHHSEGGEEGAIRLRLIASPKTKTKSNSKRGRGESNRNSNQLGNRGLACS